jgi:hypothetical protein
LNGDFVLVMVVVCDGGGLWGLWWCYCRDGEDEEERGFGVKPL